MVIGTPRYMSPEQAAGRDLDGRSDLFSLGAILYELLSGKKAFGSDSIATLMLQISLKNPAPLRSISPDISEVLQRIVMKLLSKLPEQRFQTGAEAADALERELAAAIAEETKPARNRLVPLRLKLTRWWALVSFSL
jgi:serine/threonine protein kinase